MGQGGTIPSFGLVAVVVGGDREVEFKGCFRALAWEKHQAMNW